MLSIKLYPATLMSRINDCYDFDDLDPKMPVSGYFNISEQEKFNAQFN